MYKSIHVMAFNWFAYMGGDVLSPGSYAILSGGDNGGPGNCIKGCTICAIRLNDNNDTPATIPGAVLAAIVEGTGTLVNKSILGVLYVRMKSC